MHGYHRLVCHHLVRGRVTSTLIPNRAMYLVSKDQIFLPTARNEPQRVVKLANHATDYIMAAAHYNYNGL